MISATGEIDTISINTPDSAFSTNDRCLPSHLQEWIESTVNPDLIRLNVISLSGVEPLDRLLYGLPATSRRNDGRLRDKWLKRYAHCEHGGWWVSGVDVLDKFWSEDLWGQFKANCPRLSFDRRKTIKYEGPPKLPTGIIAFKVSLRIWQAIALRYNIPLPENITVTPDGRALGFWAWVIEHPEIPLIITEGAKKAGCLITANYIAIALPGIYNGYRQPKDKYGKKTGSSHLIPQLLVFAQKNREIIFCFDNDTKSTTIKNVNTAIALTGKLLMAEGCRVSRISWDYPFKGVDDLIAARGTSCFDELYQKRSPLPKTDLFSLSNLGKYKPIIINQQYLDNSLIPPDSAQLIALKSPKGSNKTGWLGEITAKAIYQGQPVLVLTHRIQLTKELCLRFGIDHIEELRISETAGMLGYGFCIDSLHPNSQTRFNPDNWDEAIVILDEVEQTIWHLLNSSTCEKNRVAIIKNLQALLTNAIETGGKIYLSDADLSTISIDYIKQLIDRPVETTVVENQYVRNRQRKLVNYSGSDPSNLFAELIEFIEDGQKAFIQTTGQKAGSKWGTINIESYLTKKFPHHKILRIDGESVADPNHPAYGCMANLNSILLEYDIAIASPVIETGVSIECHDINKSYSEVPVAFQLLLLGINTDLGKVKRTPHFDAVWAIAYGLQSVDAVCQTVERVRDDIPRHIWAKKTAKDSCVGNGSTLINSLLASENKKAVANIRQLHLAGIEEFDTLDLNFSTHSLNTWAKRACIVNYGKANYRDEIVGKLLAEGYELFDKEDDKKGTVVKQEIKENCQENYLAYNKAVAEVETVSDTELEELKDKRAKTQIERLKEKKGNLVEKYGVEVTPKLVESDDKGLYPQLQLHYYLSVGKAKLPERDRKTLFRLTKEGDGKVFSPDLNKRQLLAKVKALEIIGIEQFFNEDTEFTKESLADWLDFIIPFRFDLKSILGVSINPEKDSAIAVAQRFLKKLGLKLEFKCWRGDRKNKQRIYSGCNVDVDRRSQIFDYWLSKG